MSLAPANRLYYEWLPRAATFLKRVVLVYAVIVAGTSVSWVVVAGVTSGSLSMFGGPLAAVGIGLVIGGVTGWLPALVLSVGWQYASDS